MCRRADRPGFGQLGKPTALEAAPPLLPGVQHAGGALSHGGVVHAGEAIDAGVPIAVCSTSNERAVSKIVEVPPSPQQTKQRTP